MAPTRMALMAIFVAAAAVAGGGAAAAAGDVPIPEDKGGVNSWFTQQVRPFAERKATLDPALVAAEEAVRIVKVRKDGSGDFKTIGAAVKTVPAGNTERVIIDIGPGVWEEKILIDFNQPFVSLVGYSAKDRPTITYSGTAKQYGTVDSATVIVLAQYFVCANLIIKNGAPRPDPYTKNGQALAVRINGDKGAFYNCKFLGFQDTLCDDRGYHFFKDCYVEGTVDFIFGRGTSLYLNTEIFVIGDKGLTVIAAQGRSAENEKTGYSFVHCRVTGTGNASASLGRPWGTYPLTVYILTEMGKIVQPAGWSTVTSAVKAKNTYYGEYKNTGPGAGKTGRVGYGKQLTKPEAEKFMKLSYIEGAKWLLPHPKP